MLTTREQLYEIDALIAANVSQISHVRNLLNSPEMAERHVNERRNTIQKLQREIAEIESVRIYGDEIIDRHKARLAELRKQRATVANQAGIERLIAMQNEMNRLESDKEPVDIAAIVQEIEDEENDESNGSTIE